MRAHPGRDGLFDQREPSGGEWQGRGVFDLDDALADAALGERQHPVMAVGVVAAPAEQRIRRPGAAASAGFRMIAAAAKTPEILDAAVAVELKRRMGRPQLRDMKS
jgi:hypothetical protein